MKKNYDSIIIKCCFITLFISWLILGYIALYVTGVI